MTETTNDPGRDRRRDDGDDGESTTTVETDAPVVVDPPETAEGDSDSDADEETDDGPDSTP